MSDSYKITNLTALTIEEDLVVGGDFTVTGTFVLGGDVTLGDNASDSITFNGTVAGKIPLALNGGAASASGLLMGVGTSADPATTSTADAKFIEVRAETTATSGDNRLMYLRYAIGAAGGGECIRAFTKLEAASTTVRGAHISLDIAPTGSASGLGVGVDNQILLADAALSGGTYAVTNIEAYSSGSSTDVSGVTDFSLLRVSLGGDTTGAANVDANANFINFDGVTAGSGNLINTDITTHTAYGGIPVNIDGVGVRYLALVSA